MWFLDLNWTKPPKMIKMFAKINNKLKFSTSACGWPAPNFGM